MFKSVKRFLSVVLTSALISSFAVFPVSAAEIDGWSVEYNGGVKATVSIDTSVSYSGSASMKVVNNSPLQSNVYVMPITHLKMEKECGSIRKHPSNGGCFYGGFIRPAAGRL